MKKLSLFGRAITTANIREVLAGLDVQVAFHHERRSVDESLLVTGPNSSSARFNLLRHQNPGDKFSNIVFSAVAFYRDLATPATEARESVLHRLGKTEMIVGVVIDPDPTSDDWRWNAVFAVAEASDAMVFDGYSLVASNGDLLLNLDGRTENEP